MARTFVQPGKILSLIAPSGGVVASAPLMIGSLFVIPQNTAAQTLPFEGMVTGVHTLSKTSAQAWTAGQKVYWNASTSKVDSDATTGPLIGVAVEIAANPTSTGLVRLNGGAADSSEGPQAAIADLTAITSGDSPTEAEHNLVVTKVNAILAALRTVGVIAT